MNQALAALREAGYGGPGFKRIYDSLEKALAGASLNLEDSHTIAINHIPNLDGIHAIFAMYENGEKKLGLALLVDIGADNVDFSRSNKTVCEIYNKLAGLNCVEDCSIEYTPGRTNQAVVDENRKDNDLLERRIEAPFTLSYAAPDMQEIKFHAIYLKMPYNEQKAGREVRYFLEHLGAKFNQNRSP